MNLHLLLNVSDSLVVLLGRRVELEDDPAPGKVVQIVDEGCREEEEADEHPSVIDDDVGHPGLLFNILAVIGCHGTVAAVLHLFHGHGEPEFGQLYIDENAG